MRHSESARKQIREMQEEKDKKFSWRAFIAPYIINPKNRYKMLWDNIVGIIYLMSFIFDPVIFCFQF